MFIDLVGCKFGEWTVLRRSILRDPKHRSAMWECVCCCGLEKVQKASTLKKSKSCGCVNRTVTATTKRCPMCKTVKLHQEFYSNRNKLAVYCKPCTSIDVKARYRRLGTQRKNTRERAQSLRAQILKEYGGACRCCGEDRAVYLALDHIFGGGTKETASGGGSTFYISVRNAGFPKDRYQLLCHNCNWAKHHTGGNCPHKQPNWMPAPIGGGPFICIGG